MKIEPKSMDEMMPDYGDGSMYPYGTEIRLEDELADGVGYDKYKAGDIVEIRAMALVTRKGESADLEDSKEGETDKCLSLQLTDITLKKAPGDYVKQLYGSVED